MIDADLAHRIRQAVTLADRRAVAALLAHAQLNTSSSRALVNAVAVASSFLSDEPMSELADNILLEVGYQHYLRMNSRRAGGRPFTRADFLYDIGARLHLGREPRLYHVHILREYLIERLQPGRLALPEGYNLGDPT